MKYLIVCLLLLASVCRGQMYNDPNMLNAISNIVNGELSRYNATNGYLTSVPVSATNVFQPLSANLSQWSLNSTSGFDNALAAKNATNTLAGVVALYTRTNDTTWFAYRNPNAFSGTVTNWYNFLATSNRILVSAGMVTNRTMP